MNFRIQSALVVTALAASLLGSCRPSTKSSSGDGGDNVELPRDTGCLAGVVINGSTGERLDLTQEGMLDNIFVLATGSRITAETILNAGGEATIDRLTGEYILCGVPLEAEFPLYAALPGFLPFTGRIYVPASAPAQSNRTEADLLPPLPTQQASLRLFPVATAAGDYKVIVSYAGAPVAGASVRLEATGLLVAAQGEAYNFLQPSLTGASVLTALTDDAGVATFATADLALGATYMYAVIPPDPGTQKMEKGQLSVGWQLEPGEPYEKHVDLEETDTELRLVSSSLSALDYAKDGAMSVVFNRPVELVPGTKDAIVASLTFATQAELVIDVPDDDAPNQVAVEIEGARMTLTPKWKTAPKAAQEPALAVTYDGIQVRPSQGQRLAQTLNVSGTVKLFGGDPGRGIPTTVTIVSGDDQVGTVGVTLPVALVVEVRDQYGREMPAVGVAFETADGGSANPPTGTTNAAGRTQTFWTLGTTGEQRLTATVAGIATPAEFSATIPVLSIVSGNTQKRLVGEKLLLPVTANLSDSDGVPVSGASVTFTVDTPASCGTLNLVGSVDDATTRTATTDADGDAVVEWKMGDGGAECSITLTATGATSIDATARAQEPTTLTLANPNSAPYPPSTALPQDIVATVLDQEGDPIQDAPVQLAATPDGTLLIAGGVAAATVQGTTAANGTIAATWTTGSANTTSYTVTADADGFAGVQDAETITTN